MFLSSLLQLLIEIGDGSWLGFTFFCLLFFAAERGLGVGCLN
jgi:hypothetical protein